MNSQETISVLAKITGTTEKQVTEVLQRMSKMPDVQKFLKENSNDKMGRR